MTELAVRNEHRWATESIDPGRWRKSPYSPAGAGAACVEARALTAHEGPDSSIIGTLPGRPPFILVPAPAKGPAASRAPRAPAAGMPTGSGGWAKGSRDALDPDVMVLHEAVVAPTAATGFPDHQGVEGLPGFAPAPAAHVAPVSSAPSATRAVPDHLARQGRLSGMTLVISLGDADHPDGFLTEQLREVLAGDYSARAADEAAAQLAPSLSLETLRPDLAWHAGGGRWRLPRLQNGLLGGIITFRVSMDEAEITDDVVDKAEIEAGGAVWASAGTMSDARNRATFGIGGKGTFGVFQSTLTLAGSRDWHDGAQAGDTGQQFSRGKIKEARTLIAATVRYTFDLSGLSWRGPLAGPGRPARQAADRARSFEQGVPASLRVPDAETRNRPPVLGYLPGLDIQRSLALDGSAFVTEAYPVGPDGAATGGGFETVLAAGAAPGRRLFARDWDEVRDELVDRIDLATLQTWLKPIMRRGRASNSNSKTAG